MNEEPIHRLYLHFQELPLSLRVLYTGTLFVLSVGYLFAIVHIYNSHAGRDGDAMLSPQDLVIAYGGVIWLPSWRRRSRVRWRECYRRKSVRS
jgi:hypothetical protein